MERAPRVVALVFRKVLRFMGFSVGRLGERQG
jgi:hypothetical protein